MGRKPGEKIAKKLHSPQRDKMKAGTLMSVKVLL